MPSLRELVSFFWWDLGVVRNLPKKKHLFSIFFAPASLPSNMGEVNLKVSIVTKHLPSIKQERKIIPWGLWGKKVY